VLPVLLNDHLQELTTMGDILKHPQIHINTHSACTYSPTSISSRMAAAAAQHPALRTYGPALFTHWNTGAGTFPKTSGPTHRKRRGVINVPTARPAALFNNHETWDILRDIRT
jgi:hypothetical protein